MNSHFKGALAILSDNLNKNKENIEMLNTGAGPMIPGYTGHRPSPLDRDEAHRSSGPRKQIPGMRLKPARIWRLRSGS